MKSRYFRCNKNSNPPIKRRLEVNDQAGINVSINFRFMVVEVNGYDNLSFGEKDCRNDIDNVRRTSTWNRRCRSYSNHQYLQFICSFYSHNSILIINHHYHEDMNEPLLLEMRVEDDCSRLVCISTMLVSFLQELVPFRVVSACLSGLQDLVRMMHAAVTVSVRIWSSVGLHDCWCCALQQFLY